MSKHRLLYLLSILISFSNIHAQSVDSLIDGRDGRIYETVTYVMLDENDSEYEMTWMAENLSYKTKESYCYDDYKSNCEISGRLYNWYGAINACPSGWHLPSDEEWTALAIQFGGMNEAAIHLRSTNDIWERNGSGTNKSLFNAMPYGYKYRNSYCCVYRNASFWSSSEKDTTYAWDWNLVTNWKKMSHSDAHKYDIFNSVRCVRDMD
ncbi:MAG: FISUMP domain-containing protein [Bacteroidota bacterium]